MYSLIPRRASWPGGLASILLAIAMLVASQAHAAEIEEIAFPEKVTAGKQRLPLHGLGLLRYRVFFRGYVGGLYLPENVPASRTLEDVPKALELYYFWDIEGRFFGEAADELLAQNHPPERIAAIRERLDRLNTLYRDVKVGDRYRLTYVPGEGTTLSHNGKTLGTIPGADFATDYFGIWLGAKPLNDAFRDQMLSGR
jgi:hypothetical protein